MGTFSAGSCMSSLWCCYPLTPLHSKTCCQSCVVPTPVGLTSVRPVVRPTGVGTYRERKAQGRPLVEGAPTPPCLCLSLCTRSGHASLRTSSARHLHLQLPATPAEASGCTWLERYRAPGNSFIAEGSLCMCSVRVSPSVQQRYGMHVVRRLAPWRLVGGRDRQNSSNSSRPARLQPTVPGRAGQHRNTRPSGTFVKPDRLADR
jgi:hypothetical protein